MLESKSYSNPAISHLKKLVGRLPNIFGRQPTSPTNVKRQILF